MEAGLQGGRDHRAENLAVLKEIGNDGVHPLAARGFYSESSNLNEVYK
jgi:hypothetical protein